MIYGLCKRLRNAGKSRKRVNKAIAKQREKIAILESRLEQAFNAGFSIGFGSRSMNDIEGQFEKFRDQVE